MPERSIIETAVEAGIAAAPDPKIQGKFAIPGVEVNSMVARAAALAALVELKARLGEDVLLDKVRALIAAEVNDAR